MNLDEFLNDTELIVVLVSHDEIRNNEALLNNKIVYDTRNIIDTHNVRIPAETALIKTAGISFKKSIKSKAPP